MARVRLKARRKKNNALGTITLVSVLATLVWGLSQRDRLVRWLDGALPIRYVRVEGELANLDTQGVRAVVNPLVHHGFLTLDLDAIERAVLDVAWVRSVRISRVWPDTVQLDIQEQKPVARWGNGSLITEGTDVFPVSGQMSDYEQLPNMQGPVGRKAEVLRLFSELNKKYRQQGISVTSLTLSERLATSIVLSDGLVVAFGNQDPLSATDRLLFALPKLSKEYRTSLKSLDMRYPQGFAVTWKEPAATRPDPAASDKPRI